MKYTHIPIISCLYSDKAEGVLSSSIFLPEAHFEYEMIFVTSGKAEININHKKYELHEKSLVFISRLEQHSFKIIEEPYCRFVVSMSSELIMSNIKDMELTSIFIQRPKDFNHVIALNDKAFVRLLHLFKLLEEDYLGQQAFYVSRCTSLVVSILIELYRAYPECFPSRSNTNISTAVLKAQRYISDNFNHKITITEIAHINHLSSHSLSLAFKDIVGITFKEYLLLFRITEAKKLLITTDLSIESVAEKVGYINVNNFVQIFKKKEKITPLQYRKQF